MRCWFFSVGFWCGLLAVNQAPGQTRPGFSVAHWNTESGLPQKSLPQNSIIAMARTPEGYLWLGTLRGLARFDGRQFTVFDESNTPELGSGTIVFLFADSRGSLWVGTEAAGSVLIKRGVVTPLGIGGRGRAARLVSACEQTNGVVWLCTANGQLGRYTEGSLAVWQLQTNAAFIGEYRSLALDGDTLWLGAQGRLMAYDTAAIVPGQSLPPEKESGPLNVDLLVPSATDGFWLLANRQVRKYRARTIERDFGAYPWTNAPVFSAVEDRDGNLAVGTQDRGVALFDRDGRTEILTSPETLSHNTVLSLLADREGSLWVGTDGDGLNRLKRQEFEVRPESQGKKIESVCSDGNGGVWFAIDREPLRHWRAGQLREFGKGEGLANLNLRSVFVDRQGTVWAGTEAGLFQMTEKVFRPAPKSEVLPRAITVLHQDHNGTLWAGTRNGLANWDGTNWTRPTPLEGLRVEEVRALADDAEGNLWIGTANGGLSRLREGKLTTFLKRDGLPSDHVSAVLVDAEGILWVGTSGSGLARFAAGKWTRYSTSDGLSGNSIGFLIEDREANLWIGSNAGLMRVTKAELNQFAEGKIPSVRCRSYGSQDGLPTRECSPGGQPAACRTPDGTLWFSMIKGLGSVNPSRLWRNTNPPPVMIEAVLVDDELQNTNRLRLNWPEAVTIPAGRERLEIRYTSLNLLAPERARFRYQLEDYESGWTEAGDIRVAQYRKLTPGTYRFRVIACNEDDVWNETGATLSVIVEPPFWQTWWFLTLSAAAFLGAINGTVHFISTQKLQRQLAQLKQQEALEKERSRIARDLHDQLGANLTQVSLLAEMVETDKALPDEVESHAQQITQTARLTSSALDEIVWATNPANDTLDSLVTYCCKYAQEYLALAGLSYRIEAPDDLPPTPIAPDVRHNVFLAFKESVNNVVKHARARTAKVRLAHDEQSFTFEIQDDGCGLPSDAEHKGRNGLRNMRKRMEDVGGAFTGGAAPEGGTLIRLTAPLGNRPGKQNGS